MTKEQELIFDDVCDANDFNENQELILYLLLSNSIVFPSMYLMIDSLLEFTTISRKLTELGIKNNFNMGKNWMETTIELDENAIGDYIIRRRSETISNIIN